MKYRSRFAVLAIALFIAGGLFVPSRALLATLQQRVATKPGGTPAKSAPPAKSAALTRLSPMSPVEDLPARPDGETVGVPYVGEIGISESVDEIMVRSLARDRALNLTNKPLKPKAKK